MPFFRSPSEHVTFPAACEQPTPDAFVPPRVVMLAELNVAPVGSWWTMVALVSVALPLFAASNVTESVNPAVTGSTPSVAVNVTFGLFAEPVAARTAMPTAAARQTTARRRQLPHRLHPTTMYRS